jgi:hypothetical protein
MATIEISQLEALPRDAVEELRRGAEECLNGTITLAIASDQRSTTLAGVFGAGSVGILAAYLVIPSAERSVALAWAAGALVFGLFVASLISVWASRSVDFHVGGYEPRSRLNVASKAEWLVDAAVVDLQHRIEFNRRALESAGNFCNAALTVAGTSAILAPIIFLAFGL